MRLSVYLYYYYNIYLIETKGQQSGRLEGGGVSYLQLGSSIHELEVELQASQERHQN